MHFFGGGCHPSPFKAEGPGAPRSWGTRGGAETTRGQMDTPPLVPPNLHPPFTLKAPCARQGRNHLKPSWCCHTNRPLATSKKKKKGKMSIFQLGDQGSVRTSCPRGSQLRYRLPVIKALCYFPPVWRQKLPSIIATRFHSRNDTFWRTQDSDLRQKLLLHDPILHTQ